MVEEPDELAARYVEAGCELLIVHAEACRHLHRTLATSRELGARPAVALNPATPVERRRARARPRRPGARDDRQPGLRRPGLHRHDGAEGRRGAPPCSRAATTSTSRSTAASARPRSQGPAAAGANVLVAGSAAARGARRRLVPSPSPARPLALVACGATTDGSAPRSRAGRRRGGRSRPRSQGFDPTDPEAALDQPARPGHARRAARRSPPDEVPGRPAGGDRLRPGARSTRSRASTRRRHRVSAADPVGHRRHLGVDEAAANPGRLRREECVTG